MPPVTLSPNGLDRYQLAQPLDHLLVATVDGVVELRQHGGRWEAMPRELAGVHVSALLAGATSTYVYAGSHADGIFRRGAGETWRDSSAGLGSRNVFSLAQAEGDAASVLYAGTEPAMLFQSVDLGATWTELEALGAMPGRETWDFPAAPNVAHAKHVDFDPRDPQTFYVAIEQGALLKTLDGGRTFRELPFHDASYFFNKDAHRVAVNPKNPDEIYLTGGDGISRSCDAGSTWERVTTRTMRIGYPDGMFCSPETDGVLYVTGAGERPGRWRQTGTAEAAFMRSDDRGASWTMAALPDFRGNIEAATLVAWSGGYGFLLGTSDGEVFLSDDRGQTWTTIVNGLPAISKCIHAANLALGRA